MKYRILQKGNIFKVQEFSKKIFIWKWRNIYENYYCGDGGIHSELAVFISVDEAKKAIKKIIEEENIEKIGWQVIEDTQ